MLTRDACFADIVQQVSVRPSLRDGDEGLLEHDPAGHHARQGERPHPHARRRGLRLRILAPARGGIQGGSIHISLANLK